MMRIVGMTLGVSVFAAFPLMASLPNPILQYSFDEIGSDGRISDLSGGGQSLTLGTGASITNNAAVGNALWFDGTQSAYSCLAMSAALKASKSRTISFWMFRDPHPGTYFETAYSDADKNSAMPTVIAGLNTFFFRLNNGWLNKDDHSRGGNNYQLVAWFGAGTSLGGHYFNYPKYPEMLYNKWVHVAYSVNVKAENPGDEYICDNKIYINGECWYYGKDQACSNITATSTYSYLGNNGVNGKRPYHGAIDELKVYAQALTDDQVKEEFSRAKDAFKYHLVAWYPLQEFTQPNGDGVYTSPDATEYGKAHGTALECTRETSVVDGPFAGSKAIHFNGTFSTAAYARIPYPMDEATISAWVNISTNTSIIRVAGQTANYPRLLTMGNLSAYYVYSINSTKMQYSMIGDTTIRNFDNNGCIGKGNWQHVTLVQRVKHDLTSSGDSRVAHMELYQNGVLTHKATDTELPSPRNAADVMLILGNTAIAGSARPFEGDVMDVRIFEGAMTADEVMRLYRGAATVDAGADFTVAGSRAVLAGKIANRDMCEWKDGYDGEVSWSLVSAPAGVSGVTMLRSSNPVCEVELPAEGAYVFKLATKGFCGSSSEDLVTVTRDDANGTASVVPAVDVDAVASNALVKAGLSNGLIRYWKGNGRVRDENVSGNFPVVDNDFSKARIVAGVTGSGFGTYPGIAMSRVSTGMNCGETCRTWGGGCQPDNEWLTISAWIKPEADYPADWFAGVICHIPMTLSISYGKWYSPDKATGPIPGMSILQTGIKGYQAWLNYDLPQGMDVVGKWNHVLALVNRWDTSKCELYLNGVKLVEDVAHKSYGNYGTYTESNYAPFSGKPCGGRYTGDPVLIGGLVNELGGVNNTVYVAKNTSTQISYYRHFPGAIDEIRFYNRKLTETEIGYLAANPDPDANEAPAVGKATAVDRLFVAKTPNSISAAAADDGNVGGLKYEWQVVSGDASQVTFADRNAACTTATVAKAGAYAFVLKVSDGERVTYGEPIEFTATARGMVIVVR